MKEIFKQAVDNHKKNNFQVALNLYNKVLEIEPKHIIANSNIGAIFLVLGNYQKAKDYLEKTIKIDPNYLDAYNNLGITLKMLGDNHKAIKCYEKIIKINPSYVSAYNNLGSVFYKLKEYNKAQDHFEMAININPKYLDAYNNLGNTKTKLGEHQKAITNFEKAIQIDPNYTDAHYNLGLAFGAIGEYNKSKKCFKRVIQIDVNYSDAYWNLYTVSSNIDEALSFLKKISEINNKHIKSNIMLAALEGYKGNFNKFNDILKTSDSNHPYMRSVKWVFSLHKLPKVFFNRNDFFDSVVSLTDNSRPFYEFGVWNGVSFQYLINTFKKGFGFDTFTGLPDNWHNETIGAYSSFGMVPKIEGGEFIVGEFKKTLPKFFSKKRPKASLINFDADMYSSTLCALNYANNVIDEKTILIFDELIMNENWEEDEFRALNEFCKVLGYNYEILAISFASKQVAVQLNK